MVRSEVNVQQRFPLMLIIWSEKLQHGQDGAMLYGGLSDSSAICVCHVFSFGSQQ